MGPRRGLAAGLGDEIAQCFLPTGSAEDADGRSLGHAPRWAAASSGVVVALHSHQVQTDEA